MSIDLSASHHSTFGDKPKGLWRKLKKSLSLLDEPMQKNNTNENKGSYDVYAIEKPQIGVENNRRSPRLIPNGGQVKPIDTRSSLRQVQLELANHDHETNILNCKPIPKKLLPTRPSPGELKKQSSSSTLHRQPAIVPSSQAKELVHFSTITFNPVDRKSNGTPENTPHSSTSKAHLHPDTVIRRSPISMNGNRSPNSSMKPVPLTSGASLWGKVRQQYAPTAVELAGQPPTPKLATFSNLWKMIFDTVRDSDMLNLEEPDPKIWWRKVFLNMKKRHGKGEIIFTVILVCLQG